MNREDFIDVCQKIKGYDAVIMNDDKDSVCRRYMYTDRSILLSEMVCYDLGYGWAGGVDRYRAMAGFNVLVCDAGNIHKYADNKKLRILQAIKDFK